MPHRYLCSQCGRPITPAQNRCPHCGAEIDWEKAVGRVVHLGYEPRAQRRRRRRRRAWLALFILLGLGILAAWAWQQPGIQARWQAFEPGQDYRAGIASLKAGNWDEARAHFTRMLATSRAPTTPPHNSIPSPTLRAPVLAPPSPTRTMPLTPTPTPTLPPSPLAPTPSPTSTPPPWQQLQQQAQALAEQDPCAAAALMAQALTLADTPDLAQQHQALVQRCQAAPFPSPTPDISLYYTTYALPQRQYQIRRWDQGARWPDPTDILPQAMQPAMAPDRRMAYRSLDPASPGLFLRDPDGHIQPLTQGPDDALPRWSPDGHQVLFTSALRSPDQSPHLYLLDVATLTIEPLAAGMEGDWGPQGILYHGCDPGGQTCGLRLLDTTTLQSTPITQNPADHAPVFSPDGRFAAFMTIGSDQSWDIAMIELSTGLVEPVSLHPAEDGLPIWSPDGKAILFLSNRQGDWAIYQWRLDNLSLQRLAPVGPVLPNWQQAGFDIAPPPEPRS